MKKRENWGQDSLSRVDSPGYQWSTYGRQKVMSEIEGSGTQTTTYLNLFGEVGYNYLFSYPGPLSP